MMATTKAKGKEPDPKDCQRQGSSSTVTKQKNLFDCYGKQT